MWPRWSKIRWPKAAQLGLYLVLLGKIVMVSTMMMALRKHGLAFTPELFAFSIAIGVVVFVGHVLCLSVSREVKARRALIWALWCNVVGNALQIAAQGTLDGVPMRLAGLTLKWFSFILFMMFMVGLARWLQRHDLLWMVSWHRGLVGLGFVLAILGGPLAFAFGGFGLTVLASPFGITMIVVGLIVYVGLIANLAFAMGGPSAESSVD